MYFFKCPKCEKRKDGKRRTDDCCTDCYKEEKARKRGVKSLEEELKEREEAVQQREEAVQRREDGVRVREELVSAREQAVGVRECMQKVEEEKMKQAQKRAREEEEGPSPKQRRFCDLRSRRQQQLVAEAASHIKRISRGDHLALLGKVAGKLGWRTAEQREINFVANLVEFSREYLPSLPEPNRIAGLLTRGLTLQESHELTGVPLSSLSWGRNELEEGRFFRPEASKTTKARIGMTAQTTSPSPCNRHPHQQFARLLMMNGLRSETLSSRRHL